MSVQLINMTALQFLGKVSVFLPLSSITCFSFIFFILDSSVPMSTSLVLKHATVQRVVESNLVNVFCDFEDDVKEASCVLVYRKYDSEKLMRKEYAQNFMFPATVNTVYNPTSYTFAVFGKRGDEIEERQFMSLYKENDNTSMIGETIG